MLFSLLKDSETRSEIKDLQNSLNKQQSDQIERRLSVGVQLLVYKIFPTLETPWNTTNTIEILMK